MSRKYKIRNQASSYFVTFTVINWIDVFTRDVYSKTFVESVKHCQEHKGLQVYAYCIMPSHVHLIIRAAGQQPLMGIIRDMKSYTSRSIRKLLEDTSLPESRRAWMLKMMYNKGKYNSNNNDYQFWQQHSHPVELYDQIIDQKLNYIHNNPVTAGYVDKPEDWVYSSARDYLGCGKGTINILFI